MWTHDSPGLLMAAHKMSRRAVLYFVVEALPVEGWVWVIWIGGVEIATGDAEDPTRAREQAEHAAYAFIDGDLGWVRPQPKWAVYQRHHELTVVRWLPSNDAALFPPRHPGVSHGQS